MNGTYGVKPVGSGDEDPLSPSMREIEPDKLLVDGKPSYGCRVRLPYERAFAIWLPLKQVRTIGAMQGQLQLETAALEQAGHELALAPIRSCLLGPAAGLLYADADERPLAAAAPEAAGGLRSFLLAALMLADALRRLHERGIAHGQLSPERVWLHAPSGSVRFCGFAAAHARAAAADVAALGRLLAWLTHGGQAPYGAAEPLAPACALADGSAVPSALALLLRRFAAAAAPEASPLSAADAQRELQRAFRSWSLLGRLSELEPSAMQAAVLDGGGIIAPQSAAPATVTIAAGHSMIQPDPSEELSELARMKIDLQAAHARIEKLEESRRHLISNLSHELRTPITLIQGYAEGLLDGVINGPQRRRRSLEMIYGKTVGMDRLISDLFELTALESRQACFNLQPVLVLSLKEYLRTKYELDVEQAGHKFRVSVGKRYYKEALYVNVDLNRMDQVFTNLFTNAIRYMPIKAGILHIDLDYLDCDSESQLIVRVKDNGSGIAEKDIPFIFDRFYTSESSRNPARRGGIGLGLSICQEIIASHGGSICASSEPGEGAEFHFTIPITARVRNGSDEENNH